MATVLKVRVHQFGDGSHVHVERVEPSGPDAGQVLVRVVAAGVNPVDFKICSGKYPAVQADRLPYTLGREVSGVIEKCGAQATRFKVGDEILSQVPIYGGGYAEAVVVEEHASALKPASLGHLEAATLPLAGQTAWQGLFRYGELRQGQRVLIHGGSGGVGHFAIQFAKARGAQVYTTVSSENVEFAEDLGADVVIDYTKERFEKRARDMDVVFDLVDGETRERSWAVIKPGGILVSTLTEPSQEIANRQGVRALRYTVQANGQELSEIAELVVRGHVKPHVHGTYALRDAAQALSAVEEGSVVGKVVLRT